MSLPPELWIEIIKLATSVPSELNTNAASLFERCTHSEAHRMRSKILPTRRALSRVSRSFHAMANPFLYQSILIQRGGCLRRLAHTLRVTADADKEAGTAHDHGGRGHGRWVKRFDVDFKKVRHWRKIPHEEIFWILSNMPNLEAFVAFGRWELSNERLFVTGLKMRNLKMLYLPLETLPRFEGAMFELISTQPLSDTLITYFPNPLASEHSSYEEDTESTKSYGFKDPTQARHLRAITASDSWLRPRMASDPAYFPKLTTMHVYSSINPELVKTHGYKITTLDLEGCPWRMIAQYIHHMPNLASILIDLIHAQPVTTTVAFALPNGFVLGSEFQIRTVRRVGLLVNAGQAPISTYNSAFEFLPKLFPNVKIIRLLERDIIDQLVRLPQRVKRWHSTLGERNIRLEREDGELLIHDCRDSQGQRRGN